MYLTYADIFCPTARTRAGVYNASLVLAGSMLLTLTAHVAFYLPVTLVPITGQTFAVLLLGALLGPWRGTAAVVVYLLEGAAGLPVFAAGFFGLGHLLGPTGGYLLAFVPAAWLTGWLARLGWDRRLIRSLPAMILGNAVILLGGTTWLACYVGFSEAVRMGVAPFLVGDLIKIAAAAGLLPAGWKLLRWLGSGRE